MSRLWRRVRSTPGWVLSLALVVLAGLAGGGVLLFGPGSGGTHPSASSGSPNAPTTAPVSPATTPATTPRSTRTPPHVMIIVMENESTSSILGNRSLPYINGTLASHYPVIEHSYAVAHPSLPNYLELSSGSTWGVTTDCPPGPGCRGGSNLAHQLDVAGISWAGYMESMPYAGYAGGDTGGDDGYGDPLYQVHHNPFMYYPDLASELRTHVKPLTSMIADLDAPDPPAFVWVTPNMVHDMHDGPMSVGDKWLSTTIPAVQATSWYQQGGTIVVTWDEGAESDTSGLAGGNGGHIAGFVISRSLLDAPADSVPVDQAGMLRSIEQAYGVAPINDAANPAHGSLAGLP